MDLGPELRVIQVEERQAASKRLKVVPRAPTPTTAPALLIWLCIALIKSGGGTSPMKPRQPTFRRTVLMLDR